MRHLLGCLQEKKQGWAVTLFPAANALVLGAGTTPDTWLTWRPWAGMMTTPEIPRGGALVAPCGFGLGGLLGWVRGVLQVHPTSLPLFPPPSLGLLLLLLYPGLQRTESGLDFRSPALGCMPCLGWLHKV